MKHETNRPVFPSTTEQDTSKYMADALSMPGSALQPLGLGTANTARSVSPGLGWPYQTFSSPQLSGKSGDLALLGKPPSCTPLLIPGSPSSRASLSIHFRLPSAPFFFRSFQSLEILNCFFPRSLHFYAAARVEFGSSIRFTPSLACFCKIASLCSKP